MADDVTDYLHKHIPMTRHMGVRVFRFDETSIALTTPLAPNLNHRESAFGGSIVSLAVVAGWTLIHLRLEEQGFRGRLVIQHSTSEFLHPIEDDFETHCSLASLEEWDRFRKTLSRRGKARLTLKSESKVGERTLAVHEGTYVAIALPQDAPGSDSR